MWPLVTSAQSRQQEIKNFNSYITEYRTLFSKCLPSRKSARMFVDITNCVWRKDQIILKKYKLYDILYDASYDRYSQMFNMAKTATLEINTGGWEYFSEASVGLEVDTEEYQLILMKEYLGID
jgi:hypothetical protein